MSERLEQIKKDIEIIELDYDIEGYINPNATDKLIIYAKALINHASKLEEEIKRYWESCDRLEDLNQRYKHALEYISKIEQPDGGYVSRIDATVTKARQALEDSE